MNQDPSVSPLRCTHVNSSAALWLLDPAIRSYINAFYTSLRPSLQRRPSRARILAAVPFSDPTYHDGRTMVGRIMMPTDAAKLSHPEISTWSGSTLHQDCGLVQEACQTFEIFESAPLRTWKIHMRRSIMVFQTPLREHVFWTSCT